jgi:hypothetical protein
MTHRLSIEVLGAWALAVALIGLTGCGSRDQPHDVSVQGVQLPEWVADPFMNDRFGAVGISRTSLGGMQEQIDRAMAAGRTELARSIATKVQAAYVRYFTEGGDVAWSADGGVDRQELAQEMSENVSRQITDQLLQGSRRKDMWIHPKNQDLYVWVIIDPAKMDLVAQQVKAQASKELQSRAQVRAELKAKDALKRLDEAIDNELMRQQGDIPSTNQ